MMGQDAGCVKFTAGMRTGLYGAAILVPFGIVLVAIVASVAFYTWRERPETYWDAQAINRHGWLAVAAGTLFWSAVVFLMVNG